MRFSSSGGFVCILANSTKRPTKRQPNKKINDATTNNKTTQAQKVPE
jgi:hypothetical protein